MESWTKKRWKKEEILVQRGCGRRGGMQLARSEKNEKKTCVFCFVCALAVILLAFAGFCVHCMWICGGGCLQAWCDESYPFSCFRVCLDCWKLLYLWHYSNVQGKLFLQLILFFIFLPSNINSYHYSPSGSLNVVSNFVSFILFIHYFA